MKIDFLRPSRSKERAFAKEHALFYWVWAGGALFAALAWFEVFYLRPGLGAPEEMTNLAYIVHAGDTWRFWLRIGGGALSRSIMALALMPPWGWRALYLFNALALGGAAWGLWCLARSLATEEAAVFTLALAFSAPFSFLQARTTFSYVLAPFLLLAMVRALRRPCGPLASMILGLCAALAWFDYEAWILVLPALAFAWFAAPRGSRAGGSWLLLGALAGGLVLAWGEAPYLGEWLFIRGQGGPPASIGFSAKLRGFFFGGKDVRAMGLSSLAAFPWAAWPGLVAGLLVAPTWLWIWASAGLLGLAAGGPFLEPNRAIVAWPALLLIAGLGSAWLWKRYFSHLSRAWIVLCVLSAPVLGYLQFNRAIAPWDAAIHGPSREVFKMADFLEERARTKAVSLGPPLEFLFHPLLTRVLADRLGPIQVGAETWFLVPRSMADPMDGRWGTWHAFEADGNPYPQYLLLPTRQVEAFLRQAAQDLAPEEQVMTSPALDRMNALRQRIQQARNAWSWTLWSGLKLRTALQLGTVQAEDVVPLLNGRCQSAEILETLQTALGSSRPAVTALAHQRLMELQIPFTRFNRVFSSSAYP